MPEPWYDRLVTVIADKCQYSEADITPDATFEALDLDSLGIVEIFTAFEKRWGTYVDDTLFESTMSMRSAAQLLEDSLRGKP
ncbi:acyl carrier protein [Streptomyces sp. NPDC007205]|uniref:acyl carrier protein n=1 Tax=Streptomyces sp. NPDC007205 TaxID=3154316 RepID=UPI0033FF5492